MNRAFIFDMDGVIVDSERHWVSYDEAIMQKLFDERIRKAIGSNVGLAIKAIYERARALGATVKYEEIRRLYDEAALDVYQTAPLTDGVDRLIDKLRQWKFKLGLVTSSPMTWVEQVIPRLALNDPFDLVLSIAERPDMRAKPNPDAYLVALKGLDADASRSFVLEDSNYGIAASKAAGIYTIGFQGNLIPGYEQSGADAFAATMDDVIKILESMP